MSRPVLVLRPQPGADATAGRARALGLEAVVSPLFRIVPRAWTWPETVEALLVTSANAARSISAPSDPGVPTYAVGGATAAALNARGFTDVRVGSAGVDAIVSQAVQDGIQSMLHLAGEDHFRADAGPMRVETRIVYASEPVEPGGHFRAALERSAVALLHSARAAARFRELAGPGHRIVAISPAVLAAAGSGWLETAIASEPNDQALLAAAARLCH